MNLNKKVANLAISLMAVVSCTSVNQNNNTTEQKTSNNNEKQVTRVDFIQDSEIQKDRYNKFEKENTGKGNQNYLEKLTNANFKYTGMNYLYKGEKLYNLGNVTPEVTIVSAYADNPVIEVDSSDKRYEKYSTSTNDVKVEDLSNGKRKITFLTENTVYLELADKNGNTKKIMLEYPIEVKDVPEIKDGMRYSELKKGYDNGRVDYSVVTYNGGYEDVAKDWKETFDKSKYEDLDDLVGTKFVDVKTTVGDNSTYSTKYIDFGMKLSDFKNKYENILTNLENYTLKFSADGKMVEGGFNPDIVEKLQKYETSENPNAKLEFVTEILDDDKTKVGKHNISRKIIKNGTVIYEKKEEAFISFSGSNVGVIDSTFYDLVPEVEARTYRYTPKSEDAVYDDTDDPNGVFRPHGSFVIGAALDEGAVGQAHFLENYGAGIRLRRLLNIGIDRKFNTNSKLDPKNDQELYKSLQTAIKTLNSVKYHQEGRIFNKKVQELYNKYNSSKREFDNILKISDENERTKKLKAYYNELYKLYENAIFTTEPEMLQYTDLHFNVIAIENNKTGNLDRSVAVKNLARMLDDNKNIKAVNMSYGTGLKVDDYIAIKNMTEEDKEKAAKAYNEDVNFRVAVQTWLQNIERGEFETYRDDLPGTSNIPSVLKYFKSRDKITKNDYQKILDLKLLLLKNNLAESPELKLGDKDVIFVVSQGNTKNNDSTTEVNLTDFSKDGKKIIYYDLDHVYDNSFFGTNTYLKLLEDEEAAKRGEKPKFNTGYRKNILGVVGLMSGKLQLETSDKFYNNKWKLVTVPGSRDINNNPYIAGLKAKYDSLYEELSKVNANPSKYPEEYKEEIMVQIQSIDNLLKMKTDVDGRDLKASFTRAGKSKLSVVSSEGHFVYNKKLTDKEKENVQPTSKDSIIYSENYGVNFTSAIGSSFAAPRVTAIAGLISTKFPWLKAQQIKQVILTTADDDYTVEGVEPDEDLGIPYSVSITGLYGPDENLGWGMANKYKALNGPGRFVKALTGELDEDNFVADVPYGYYEFKNNIEGKLELGQYFASRGKIDETDAMIYDALQNYDKKFLYSDKFGADKESKGIKDLLNSVKKDVDYIYNTVEPKLIELYNTLDEEEKELFVDAGITKKGKGSLMLSGDNSFKGTSIVEEGTLILGARNLGDYYVKENGKLKLDVVYNQKRTDKERLNPQYLPYLKGSITNEGEVYSYSKFDILNNTYKPVNKGKTYISAQAHFQIDKLDLSSVDKFNFDVFRKKGMEIFDIKQYENSQPNPENPEEMITKLELPENPDKVTFLTVNKLAKSDLYKVKLGDTDITPFIKIRVEKEDINDDKNNVKLTASLVRTNETSTPVPTASRLRAALRNQMLNSNEIEAKIINSAISTLEWMETNGDYLLKGEVLANSQIIGYEVLDLKTNLLKERLATDIKKGNSAVYFDSLISNKFKFSNEDKNVLTNGFNLGYQYRSKYNTTGVSLNYSNSKLFDYTLPLLDVKEPMKNTLTPEEKKKEEERRAVKTLQGSVYANILGFNTYNKFELNSGYLTSIFSADLISKSTSRKLLDREVRNMDSTDVSTNLNLEGGYKFNIKNKITVEPFLGLDLTAYIRGQFNETLPKDSEPTYKPVAYTEFGYKSNTSELNFKSKLTIGSRVRMALNENWNLGLYASYTKYLTDPTLKVKAELTRYNFKEDIKGVSLDDHVVNYGFDARYTLKDNIEFKLSYSGRNLKTHGLSTGIRYQF